MDALQQYTAAMFPRAWSVLGIRLQPYCLGHALALQYLRSPFVAGGKPGLVDLLLAVAICSRRPERLDSGVKGRSIQRQITIWHWQIRFYRWMGRDAERIEATALDAFYRYIASQSAFPQFWVKQGKKKAVGTPWLALLKLTLMVHLGKTEAEALATPLGLAHWDYCAYWESQEALELTNRSDNDLFAAAREEVRKLIENQGNAGALKPIQPLFKEPAIKS